MKATHEIGSREIRLTNLPEEVDGIGGMPTEMTIAVRYTKQGGCFVAVQLDHTVIPAIVKALNSDT